MQTMFVELSLNAGVKRGRGSGHFGRFSVSLIPADLYSDKTMPVPFRSVSTVNLGRKECKLRSRKLMRHLINDADINVYKN